jgi:hypothetical protein
MDDRSVLRCPEPEPDGGLDALAGHRRVLRVELDADELAAVLQRDEPGRAGSGERVEHDAAGAAVTVGARRLEAERAIGFGSSPGV